MDRQYSLPNNRCPICFDEVTDENASTLECGHTTCKVCSPKMKECCQCRAPAKRRKVLPKTATPPSPEVTDLINVKIGRAGKNRVITVLAPIKEERGPMCFALAFDVSGSMTTLMPDVIAAAERLLKAISNGDQLTMLTFSNVIENTYGPVTVSPETMPGALKFVRSMKADGSTDIKLAVETAMNLISGSTLPKVVATLTDGSDDTTAAQWTDIASYAHWNNIILSLVGIGPNVSVSMCSCKHFACVLNPDALQEVMDNWMQTMQLLYAQNLILMIETDPGCKIMSTENAEGTVVPPDGVLGVPIDNLYSTTPVYIGVVGNVTKTTAKFTSGNKTFTADEDDQTTDFQRLQIELITLTALKEALKLASQQQYDQVQPLIKKAKEDIIAINATLAEPHLASLDQVVHNMSDEDSYANSGSGIQTLSHASAIASGRQMSTARSLNMEASLDTDSQSVY